jgi:hypothetical protein
MLVPNGTAQTIRPIMICWNPPPPCWGPALCHCSSLQLDSTGVDLALPWGCHNSINGKCCYKTGWSSPGGLGEGIGEDHVVRSPRILPTGDDSVMAGYSMVGCNVKELKDSQCPVLVLQIYSMLIKGEGSKSDRICKQWWIKETKKIRIQNTPI